MFGMGLRLRCIRRSTGAMGSNEEFVVDLELQVRGVDGLRIVDGSVIPLVPRGNTTAPIIMVAKRAADMIRGRAQLPPAV